MTTAQATLNSFRTERKQLHARALLIARRQDLLDDLAVVDAADLPGVRLHLCSAIASLEDAIEGTAR